MIKLENIFQNGGLKKFPRGTRLFAAGEAVRPDAIFFIKQGLIRFRILKKDLSELKIFLKEGDLFGMAEVYAGSDRVSEAVCESDAECYVWSKESFFLTVSMIWELSLFAIKSLSVLLKIINAEFVDKTEIRF